MPTGDCYYDWAVETNYGQEGTSYGEYFDTWCSQPSDAASLISPESPSPDDYSMEDWLSGESDAWLYDLYADWFNSVGGGSNTLTYEDLITSSGEPSGNVFWGGDISWEPNLYDPGNIAGQNFSNVFIDEGSLSGFNFAQWLAEYGDYIPNFGMEELNMIRGINKYDRDIKVKSALDKIQNITVGTELYGANNTNTANALARATGLGISRLEGFQGQAAENQLFDQYEADIYAQFSEMGEAEVFNMGPESEFISDYDITCEQVCSDSPDYETCMFQCSEIGVESMEELWG